MDRATILEKLRTHAPELRAAGISHLRLFGSLARNEQTPSSDIDLLADFDQTHKVTLVTLGSLEARLAVLLGGPVELSSEKWLREAARARVTAEAIVAF